MQILQTTLLNVPKNTWHGNQQSNETCNHNNLRNPTAAKKTRNASTNANNKGNKQLQPTNAKKTWNQLVAVQTWKLEIALKRPPLPPRTPRSSTASTASTASLLDRLDRLCCKTKPQPLQTPAATNPRRYKLQIQPQPITHNPNSQTLNQKL